MRDYQRQKVYDAEQAVRRTLDLLAQGDGTMHMYGSTIVVPQEVKFGTLDAVQQYVDNVQATKWYRARRPQAPKVRVQRRRGNSFAHYEVSTIYINDTLYRRRQWAMRELVVLHELAHHTAWTEPHGPEFAAEFLWLVEHAMGPEVAWILRDAFYASGVKIA